MADLVRFSHKYVNVSETTIVVSRVIEDSTLTETAFLSEGIVRVQAGDIAVSDSSERAVVGLNEQTDYFLLTVDSTIVEALNFSENVVVVLFVEPDVVMDHPIGGPPPAETIPPLPPIVDAVYQEDGLVRVFHLDETEAVASYPDPVSLQGQQLIAWVDDGNTIEPYVVPQPSHYQVDQERERRISKGILVILESSSRMIALQTRGLEDFRNITFLVTTAATFPNPVTFRDAYDVTQTLTAAEMVEVGQRVTEAVQDYYEAAWRLKDLTDGVPFDYTADMYWPDHSFPPEPPPGYGGYSFP